MQSLVKIGQVVLENLFIGRHGTYYGRQKDTGWKVVGKAHLYQVSGKVNLIKLRQTNKHKYKSISLPRWSFECCGWYRRLDRWGLCSQPNRQEEVPHHQLHWHRQPKKTKKPPQNQTTAYCKIKLEQII